MIGIKNITVQSGFSYQKYLSKQLDQVMQNMDLEHEYRMKDITIAVKEQTNSPLTMSSNPLELYTRSGGELFKEWGLDGYLDKDKIETISKLSLGKDDRTKDYVKIKNHTYQSVKDENDFDVILTKKDITNGYYKTLDGEKIKFEKSDVKTRTGIKRKTDIEFIIQQPFFNSVKYFIIFSHISWVLAFSSTKIIKIIQFANIFSKIYYK